MFYKKLFKFFSFKNSEHVQAQQRVADTLYFQAVEAARHPDLFLEYEVEDNVDGRFDLISLFVILIQKRLLILDTVSARGFSQVLANTMWQDMEHSVRELGVGDLAVPKHVKRMVGAFQGRARAYEKALNQEASEQQFESLKHVIWRNVYRESAGKDAQIEKLTIYILSVFSYLKGTSEEKLMTGNIFFEAPPGFKTSDQEVVIT